MYLKQLTAAFAALALSVSGFANAGIIEYNFEFHLNGESYLTGSFIAEDLNFDNLIMDDELVSLSFANDSYSLIEHSFNADNDDNFNFDITSELFLLGGNSYTETGQRWNSGGTGFAFEAGSNCAGILLSGDFQGCDASPASNIFQVTSSVSVPEPSTLAILAFGIIGLASRRSKVISK